MLDIVGIIICILVFFLLVFVGFNIIRDYRRSKRNRETVIVDKNICSSDCSKITAGTIDASKIQVIPWTRGKKELR